MNEMINKFMRKNFGSFTAVLFYGLLLFGCISQTRLATQTIAIMKPSTIPQPTETSRDFGAFLPTFTLPPRTPLPTATLPPLPKDVFGNFEKLAGYCKVMTSFGVVRAGSTIEEKVTSDMAIGQIQFSLFWQEGDFDLILIQPDKTILDLSAINADERNKSFTSKHGFEEYFIRAPKVGTWTAKITNKSKQPEEGAYMFDVSALDASTTSIHFDKKEYSIGNPIKIYVKAHDGMRENDYNRTLVVRVIAESPEKRQYFFELYDNGLHGDEEAGDGIYTNIFNNTLVAGIYKFHFKLSGLNQRVYYVNSSSGSVDSVHAPFIRECFLSTEVK